MTLQTNAELSSSWTRVGGVAGLLAIAAYLAAAFVPLPDTLGYAAAFAFGPLLAIGLVGLYHGLGGERRGPLLQIAACLGVGAGFTVLLMLTTQQAIFGVVKKLGEAAGDAAAAAQRSQLEAGLDAVHYGMDVAWDVLISAAVVLFGVGMLRHARFGPILGSLGVVLGCLLLGFNLFFFPIPPAAAGSIDWGPLVALWLLASFAMLLRAGQGADPKPRG